eukprot:NODE_18880_length_870_cov_5.880215.p1 GENE.NODE_18880_length_870_cov_5.880215~~NODE_18880_length_870_cov_5.880215.p1  ORF type:complete len:230 (+),score=35.59 NODE_18880_length_870_cov_5.880215:102-791(+)
MALTAARPAATGMMWTRRPPRRWQRACIAVWAPKLLRYGFEDHAHDELCMSDEHARGTLHGLCGERENELSLDHGTTNSGGWPLADADPDDSSVGEAIDVPHEPLVMPPHQPCAARPHSTAQHQLLTDLEAKTNAEGTESKNTFKECTAFCKERSAELNYEINTGKVKIEDLNAASDHAAAKHRVTCLGINTCTGIICGSPTSGYWLCLACSAQSSRDAIDSDSGNDLS